MKKGFKFLLITFALALTFSVGIVAYAEDATPEIYVATDAQSPDFTEENAEATENTEEVLNKEGENDALTEEKEAKNGFTAAYNLLIDHLSELLSALTLISSIVVGYLYKKGLLPSVKGVLSGINGAVGRLKESSDKEIENRKTDTKKVEDTLVAFGKSLEEQGRLISSIEERLISEEEYYKQKEKLNLILASQVDMLYNIFISSSLPQYQKDAMNEKIIAMKKELKNYE